MDVDSLTELLDAPHTTAERLAGWGISDALAAHRTFMELAEAGLTLDLLAQISGQLARHLPAVADPDAALEAFRRFLFAARSPLAWAAQMERDETLLPQLLAVLTTSPPWRELIIRDPEAFDLLRLTDGQPVTRAALQEEVCQEVASCGDERSIMAALRRIRNREMLRIGYGDIFHKHRLPLVVEQLSFLADALLEAALQAAQRMVPESRLTARPSASRLIRLTALALGRVGGSEMDYTGSVQLLLLHDPPATDEIGRRAIAEQCERLGKLVTKYLSEPTTDGIALRVENVLPPADEHAAAGGAIVWSRAAALQYFDGFGRTWHRQAFTRVRAVAGHVELGQEFLRQLQPWIYRQYLSRADEAGIKALKRRILRRAQASEPLWRDLAQARGGPRDIEAVVEFLQLLNGGDLPAVRAAGTWEAIAGLEQANVLTVEERNELEQNYEWLRRLEHRLEITGDGSLLLPESERETNCLATNWDTAGQTGEELIAAYRQRLDRTWGVLSRLLGAAFPDEPMPPPEVDLLLDPVPDSDDIERVLGAYGFAHTSAAYRNLQSLASEQIPFLSTRRCRQFLSAIIRPLLSAIAGTPDPDFTLDNLARVSDSLGSKGVLWELLKSHRPSLDLYVRLCAASPYLSHILMSNPGAIDELIDSLQLRRLPTLVELGAELTELARGSGSVLTALHGFKNFHHLQIGVRDILDKDDVDSLHQALADVAETCLARVAQVEYERLALKHGLPTLDSGATCGYVLLGLGKLGGSEPNYHSQLEFALLYDGPGLTRPAPRAGRDAKTSNQLFFAQLTQRIVKELSQLTPQGRLYSAQMPLAPKSHAPAAMSLADFTQHFASGAAPLAHWQALCKARPLRGEPVTRQAAAETIRTLLTSRPWRRAEGLELRQARLALEAGTQGINLKRGPGGTLDVEYAVQLLQLSQAAETPSVIVPGTLAALDALAAAGHLSAADARGWSESYRFLRRVESALRLLNSPAQHSLPSDPVELRKLALLLQYSDPSRLRDECCEQMAANRRRFTALFEAI